MEMLFSALYALLLCSGAVHSALISQSQIISCDWGDQSEPAGSGDGKTCKTKLVVSMTFKGGQVAIVALTPHRELNRLAHCAG